jgi:3'-phosphoadenosine 5'-phosphosulfate sulfotransferase (PAPS reductase)/FAD synthetase
MRHIIPVSGGKDSSALAILLVKEKALGDRPYELTFSDTGVELPELYEYLDRLSRYLGQPIFHVPGPTYEEVLTLSDGFLPAPWRRWCTDRLKIRPFNKWIGDAEATLYLGIRADEAQRADDRYVRRKGTVKRWPFVELDIDTAGVWDILRLHEMHDNPIYRMKPRSGCWCCFFQSPHAWRKIMVQHPALWEKAKQWERRDLEKANGSPNVFTFSAQFRLEHIEAQQVLPFDTEDYHDLACAECKDD